MTHDSTRYLFALLRKALHPERTETIPTEATPDWGTIYRLATRQGVLAIAWDGLELLMREGALTAEQQPPRALRLQWAVNVAQIEKRYRKQEQALAHLAAFYDANNIRMLVLKGYGLSLSYPRPEHRPCGDIDIWLYGEQERADRLLHEQYGIAIDEEKHHHTVFTFEGVMVENHYDFVNTKSHLSNRDYEQLLKTEAENSIESEWQGRKVMFASPRFNALFLMRHMAAHYAAERVSLRHLLDWKVFVEQCGADVDWVEVYSVYDKFKMRPFVDAVRGILVDYLGLAPELLPAPQQEDKALEERIINDILYSEFSVKCPKKGAVAIVWWKIRRFWANRWKHRLVYRESWLHSFLQMTYSHLLKPKTIANVR